MHPTVLDLATALRNLRNDRRLSQRELGERIGLTQAQISKIEGGHVDPRLSSVVEFARGVGVEVMLVPRGVVPAAVTLGILPANGNGAGESIDG